MFREVFSAMGVRVVVGGARTNELADVRALFDLWERTFSPFLPESESRTSTPRRRRSSRSRRSSRASSTSRSTGSTDGRLLIDIRFAAVDWTSLRLGGRLLRRRRGTTLDLNGVVKGLAADAALELISGRGFVSARGDVASRGAAVVGLPGGGSLRLNGRRARDERHDAPGGSPRRPANRPHVHVPLD